MKIKTLLYITVMLLLMLTFSAAMAQCDDNQSGRYDKFAKRYDVTWNCNNVNGFKCSCTVSVTSREEESEFYRLMDSLQSSYTGDRRYTKDFVDQARPYIKEKFKLQGCMVTMPCNSAACK